MLEIQTDNLGEVCDLSQNQSVSVKAEVISIKDPEPITTKAGKQLNKQDIIISNRTGTSRIVLWQEDIRSLQLHKSYILKEVVVRCYLDAKFLSMGASSTEDAIDDL